MRGAAAFLIVLPLLACSGGPENPDRERLERLYVRLIDAGTPGREPPTSELESLRSSVDSLGGAARAESLFAASIEGEPKRWKDLLDSLASRNP